jgi:hypothetical protein
MDMVTWEYNSISSCSSYLSKSELAKAINVIKGGKAFGTDGIAPEVLTTEND